jgi:Flp pilus assembly protein protease CpaA
MDGALTLSLGTVACAVASATDIAMRRIPNWLTLPLLAIAPIAVGVEQGWRAGVVSLLIVAVAIGFGLLLHAAQIFGGGDIKLLAGIAALCGFPICIDFLFYTALAGGVLALIVSAARGELVEVITRLHTRVATSLATGRLGAAGSAARIPYALAIGVGYAIAQVGHELVPFMRIV